MVTEKTGKQKWIRFLKTTFLSVRPPHPEAEIAEEKPSSSIPQNVLDCVQTVLRPYLDKPTLNKVRDAILAVNASKPEPAQDRFLSTEEIGELLHVSRVTVFRYMKAGKIQSHKLGRRNLFSLNEVIATLKNAEVANV